MFTVTHDSGTHSYHSSGPELQCLRATDASSLAHQITHSSSHRFYRPCSCWQIELWISLVRSELIDPSEELANDHTDDAQCCCLATEMPQLHECGFQTRAVGELQSLAGKLVEIFAQDSASQSAIASAAAVLQAADEMEMAELNDPALACAEPDDSRNLVGDRGADAFVYISGNRRDRLIPAPQVFPPRQEHRIEKHRSILVTRLDRHQIQDPVFSSKAEINAVQEQNQRPCWQAQPPWSRYQLSERSTKTATEPLTGNAIARCHSLQRSSLHQNCLQKRGRSSPRFAAAFLLADAPRSFAAAALATSRAEVINFRSATQRFRVQRIHARELDTDWDSKYAKSRSNYV